MKRTPRTKRPPSSSDIRDVHMIERLTVTGAAPTGAGIAGLNGLRVFVPGALPGDTVEAEVTPPAKGARSAVARVIRITESRWRAADVCPALEAGCGGCPLGRLNYEGQKAVKTALLADALKEAGVTPGAFDPIIGADDVLTVFRNKAVLYPVKTESGWFFGMFAAGTHCVVPEAACCPQVHPWMHEAVRLTAAALSGTSLSPYDETTHTGDVRTLQLREGFRGEGNETEKLVTLTVREATPEAEAAAKAVAERLAALSVNGVTLSVHPERGNAVLGRDIRTVAGTDSITADIDGLSFSVRPETFLQVNTPQTIRLYNKALEWAAPTEDDVFLDLYCGVGTMTLMGSRLAKAAVGIDIVAASIERAKNNAAENGVTNAEFYAGAVEDVLPGLIAKGLRPEAAILDPAFKGLDETVPAMLTGLPLKRFAYVSCNPKTFARDAARFQALGWTLERVVPVDLFPGALHVETVGRFVRR